MLQQDDSNQQSFRGNSDIPSAQTTLNLKEASAHPDPDPAGPTPVDDVSGGIAPIADFVPKDAPNLSHPTPPPDQPLADGATDIDTEMRDEPAETQQSTVVEPSTIQAPESAELKVEESLPNGVSDDAVPAVDALSASVEEEPASAALDIASAEPSGNSLVRPREEDAEDEPAAKRSKVEETEPESKVPDVPAAAPEIAEPAPTPVEAFQPSESAQLPTEPPLDVQPSVEQQSSVAPSQPPANAAQYSTLPMTPVQRTYLLEKMKNTKKTKHAIPFLNAVDPKLLNIPTYPDIVKHPMDLTTMENKLKSHQYASVQEFADDFNLIINATMTFNGPQHAVTQQGMNMEAYVKAYLDKVPSVSQSAPPKAAKKRSPSLPKQEPKRRESRSHQAPAASPLQNETFALQADGTPQIRRESTINRPARAIKPPQAREIAYSKPKRKEHVIELKFCEYVLDRLKSTAYASINHVFMQPVDPVALNIPQYRQIVKHPMDLTTMTQKLRNGEYGKASEFEKDFKQIIENCLLFNPHGNPVRDMGIKFRREFDALWQTKDKWEAKEAKHKQLSGRASSASNDDSAAEDSEEEDDEPQDEAQATIAILSKQLAEMQNQLMNVQSKRPKTKKSKDRSDRKGPSKKLGSLSSMPAKSSKPAPAKPKKSAKPRTVTYDDKQEISQAVEKMTGVQVEALTSIIQNNCEKYRNMGDDMELEIDDLPNDVQLLLLDHVRNIFGNPRRSKAKAPVREYSPDDVAAVDDDDFEPERGPRGGAGSKKKKHKPMGKKEQQDSINALKNQLAAFGNGSGGSESPTSASFVQSNAQAESSGDEESEESEEE